MPASILNLNPHLSIVRGPLWLVMSVSTQPGWTWFTTMSSLGSLSIILCWILDREEGINHITFPALSFTHLESALHPIFDTKYVEDGQPASL